MNAVNVYRRAWEAEWLSGDSVRACAGGVSGDDVHSATVQLLVRHNGEIAPHTQVTFAYEGNVGKPKLASLIDEQGQSVPTLTLTTDSEGKVSVKVLSSDTISQPKLLVKHDNTVFGSVDCDFDEALSKRRFANQYDPSEAFPAEDTGWLFDFPHFDTPDRTTPAKVYMKFQKVRGTGDVDGNWEFVNGHTMRFYVESVVLQDGTEVTGTPQDLKDYATIVDPNNPLAVTAEQTTSVDGAAQVMLKAGPNIDDTQTSF